MQSIELDPVPPQPKDEDWGFVKDLCEPLHQKINWDRKRARKNETDLSSGVKIIADFPDPQGLLDTAYQDINRFFRAGSIPVSESGYPIVVNHKSMMERESYLIQIGRERCELCAGDSEGIRRGLVYLEDMLLRSCGPFLPIGKIERRPWLKTRISRCFFGPIKRPPRNRDELLDDVDYYPDEYLNRLAHDAVNGLWLTVEFKDLCKTEVIPEYGEGREKRLQKLQRTVNKCARYGIKIYLFCIEPISFPEGSEILRAHPELGGDKQAKWTYFCASSELGRKYLEEATERIFKAVPGLGGLINISVGEKSTHCYSGYTNDKNCPLCSKRKPEEVHYDVLAAMERGMHRSAPEAELIAWPYGQFLCWGGDGTVNAANHIPRNVILQHTFESPSQARQLGKIREVADYSLIHVGPSEIFANCAKNAIANGNRVSAKIQVGCSHEVATVPWVPVPGVLYDKYQAMHELEVSCVMQCWYFGNYPSLMTRAAGELAFETFSTSKQAFLKDLAAIYWGKHASQVAKSWNYFQKGYKQYPLMNSAVHYNPVSDGPVWPLHLVPCDLPIAPSWLIGYPPSGDRIGECVSYSHTLEETLLLFEKVNSEWSRGIDIMRQLVSISTNQPERTGEIAVALALGIQFRSSLNIMRFYEMRENLPYADSSEQTALLEKMKVIVKNEIEMDKELADLCRQNPSLGFHSEAEGYKYFPQLIEWRIKQLEKLLKIEFPDVEKQINDGSPLFPEYTGRQPEGEVYQCRRIGNPGKDWKNLPEAVCSFKVNHKNGLLSPLQKEDKEKYQTTWQAGFDDKYLYLNFTCYDPSPESVKDFFEDKNMRPYWGNDVVGIRLETRRLWPEKLLVVNPRGARFQEIWGSKKEPYQWKAKAVKKKDRWIATMRIPLHIIDRDTHKRPMRIDVLRMIPFPDPDRGEILHTWAEQNPIRGRCGLRNINPADRKWLVWERH